MRCLACGADNRDDARFCAACGVRILARCATCDRELAAGARFCDGCGAPVVDTGGIDGDQTRKTLTIVFADLQGSTAMQERMDPESVRALMGRYYAAMRAAVETHGGKIVKFVGDGVMSVFGVPEVAEDDALRGLRSAVAMHEAFAPFADEYGLALRVGVNTGEVVVDADDADVVGDAVNVAARLEATASPGDVLVGEETWRLTRHTATFDAVPGLTLKGRATAVTAHRLTGLDITASDAGAPFVGRTDELATLRALFEDVVDQNHPRLATVIGSPGVGKSRLVQELRDELGDRAAVVRGRCDEHGGDTFAPVAQLLDGLGDLSEVMNDDTERARVLDAIDGLTGTATRTTPEETFWAVRRVLEAAAVGQPVVAVLDDLHWAEPLLLDLVEHLAEWLNQRVLLVAVTRPELRELRPSLTDLQGRTGALVALEGLERDATEQLAREHLGTDHVPPGLLDRLAASSDGNPLFVRELVRMLVDDGVVRRDENDGEGWILAVDAAELEVPPTIQSLLASRLDRLRPQERIVLERAAVIGAEVYQGALTEIVPPEVRGELETVLESMRRKELLEPAGTYWIDERVLRFHHALIREAAYRRLLKESRAQLHERVAAWLVAKTGGGPDHDESIGFHLEQAQANLRSLGPLDERGEAMATEASARLGAAARRALDRDDLLAAAGLAGRAVACLDADDRTRADILLTRCEALLGAGDVATAGPAIEELRRLGAGSRRVEAWASCFAIQHAALTDPRSLVDAESRLVDAAAVLDGAGDAAGAAKAHRVHAALLARLGRVGDCEAALDKALGAARAAGDRRQTTSVLGAAPLAALWGPSPVSRAGGRCLDVIRLVRITTGAPAVEATSIRCQAVLEAFRGRADAARSLIGTARAIAADLGLGLGLLEVELFAGLVELCTGDHNAAEGHLARAQDGFTTMGVSVDAAQAAALRGRAALALGRVDEALDHVALSEQLGGQDLKTSIAWRAVNAEILAARGEIEEATRLAEAAVALAAPTDALVDHADALAALAAVHTAAGDSAAANRVAAEARALYEQKGATALVGALTSGSSLQEPTPSAPGRTSPAMANAASRMWDEVNNLAIAGRFDQIVARYRPDVTLDDRRPGMGNRVVGPVDNIENFRVICNLGLRRVDSRAIAVRGDRLALVTTKWHMGYEVEAVAVVVVDRDGLYQQALLYDPGDLAAAVDELDRLYLAALSAEQAQVLGTNLSSVRASNQRDWVALRTFLVDDLVVVDHRPAGSGEFVGAETFIDYGRAMVEVAPGHSILIRSVLAVSDRVALGETVSIARDDDGLSYEEPRLILGAIAPDGRVSRFEFFAPEQLDMAWGRYRALSSSTTGRAPLDLRNAASDAATDAARLIIAGNVDDALALWSEHGAYEDRRPLLQTSSSGPEEIRRFIGALVAVNASTLDVEPVAVRGDRLALANSVWRGAYEVDLLGLFRIDDAGLIDLFIVFDPGDVDAAVAELNRLYIEQLDPGRARVFTTTLGAAAVHSARSWDHFGEYFSENLMFVDRRLAGYGELHGLDRLIDYGKATVDETPDFRHFVTRVLAIDDRCLLVESAPTVAGPAGGQYELSRLAVTRLGPDGRIDRYDTFDFEQIDAAWARYRELTA